MTKTIVDIDRTVLDRNFIQTVLPFAVANVFKIVTIVKCFHLGKCLLKKPAVKFLGCANRKTAVGVASQLCLPPV